MKCLLVLILSIGLQGYLKALDSDYFKHWLWSCVQNDCTTNFNSCLSCFGIRSCKNCLTNSYQNECSQCADDIFKENDLEIINGQEYLICDGQNQLHQKICHFFCRGKYFQTGICTKLNNIPICECTNSM